MKQLKNRLSSWIDNDYYQFRFRHIKRVPKGIVIGENRIYQVSVFSTIYTTVFVVTVDDKALDLCAVVRCGADDKYKYATLVNHESVLDAVNCCVNEDLPKHANKEAMLIANFGKVWSLLPTS